MRNQVKDWVQEGRLCVWRYAEARQGWRGWQWSADPPGARSLRNLLDRMHAGGPCYRNLRLEPASDTVLSVPNARYPVAERCEKLRADYQPGFADLHLDPAGEVLVLAVCESSRPRWRRSRPANAISGSLLPETSGLKNGCSGGCRTATKVQGKRL